MHITGVTKLHITAQKEKTRQVVNAGPSIASMSFLIFFKPVKSEISF